MRAIRKGFTLIELLVVLVVLGILSGIAIARFLNTKEAAYIASMKADLRNFALYEQNYLMDSQGSYFSGSGAAQGFVATVAAPDKRRQRARACAACTRATRAFPRPAHTAH